MNKLHLKTSAKLQGDFLIKELNLLLVFQVNCPGCFLYALPQAIRLFEGYGSRGLNILGLSTAFEDFELNTVSNTKLLLEEKQFVGETKRALQMHSIDSYTMNIPFPVAFDQLGEGKVIFTEADVNVLCETYPEASLWTEPELMQAQAQVRNYLFSQAIASYTFTLNQMAGTPSWVLFDKEYNVLASWFGYKPDESTEDMILSSRHYKAGLRV